MGLAEGTLVALSDGTLRPVEQVTANDHLQSFDRQTKHFAAQRCSNPEPAPAQDGLEITLENGFRVTVTEQQPVLTWDGFKPAAALDAATDLVAVAVHTPVQNERHAPPAPWLGDDESVAYLLGQLIGDGHLCGRGTALCTGTKRQHDRVLAWLEQHLPRLHRHPYFNVRSWYITLSSPELLNSPTHGNRKTRFRHWIEGLGLNVRGKDKFVPDCILRSGRTVRAAFLAGLLDSDGHWSAGSGTGICFYTSTSSKLLDGVVRLCQLEGIPVSRFPNRVFLWGQQTLKTLLADRLVVRTPPARMTNGDKVGWCPRHALTALVRAAGSEHGFARQTGIERATLRKRTAFIRTSTAQKAGIETGPVRYHRIKALGRVSDRRFYAVPVPGGGSLVANGIVVAAVTHTSRHPCRRPRRTKATGKPVSVHQRNLPPRQARPAPGRLPQAPPSRQAPRRQ